MHENIKTDIEALAFIEELDRLKNILRRTLIYDASRPENTAEHSWHLATSVMAGRGLANEPINLERAVKMALVHDVVEIDAGDTFVYDSKGNSDKEAREEKAAQRIFGLLPQKIGGELHGLWKSYEKQECAESKFVMAFDRFLPLLANFKTQGHSWKKHGVKKSQVIHVNGKMALGSQRLWKYAEGLIDEAVRKGFLQDDS